MSFCFTFNNYFLFITLRSLINQLISQWLSSQPKQASRTVWLCSWLFRSHRIIAPATSESPGWRNISPCLYNGHASLTGHGDCQTGCSDFRRSRGKLGFTIARPHCKLPTLDWFSSSSSTISLFAIGHISRYCTVTIHTIRLYASLYACVCASCWVFVWVEHFYVAKLNLLRFVALGLGPFLLNSVWSFIIVTVYETTLKSFSSDFLSLNFLKPEVCIALILFNKCETNFFDTLFNEREHHTGWGKDCHVLKVYQIMRGFMIIVLDCDPYKQMKNSRRPLTLCSSFDGGCPCPLPNF